MNIVRYYLALMSLIYWSAVIPFWLLIHPFIEFWRRLGYRLTYAINFTVMAILGAVIFLFRGRLLSIEFGTSYFLIALAVLIYSLAVGVYFKRRKHLTKAILSGLPELAPEKAESKLLTEGIYARIRHPRYLELLLGLLALAFFTNYLALYLLFPIFFAAIFLIIQFEEKELRARFGKEYERYSERVPRFVPRF
ncbi:MAG: hypothetical protein L0229_22640 [Blastocatellia bacterium]|nr:hypothetical protein [Blastocatellia bacterium]